MSNHLESVVARFETAWSGGVASDLNEFLPPADDPLRREALLELIRIDLEYRWRAKHNSGETILQPMSLHDYRERFPELTTEELVESGLIAEEYRVRSRWGDAPAAVEFARGFDVPPERIVPQLEAVANELAEEETVSPSFLEDDETLPPRPADKEDDLTSPQIETANDHDTVGRFGNYDLLFEVARGGMGVVYKARQRKLNRVVALKMIKSGQLASDDEVQRFYAEAEAAARLDHPAIVPVYDVGCEGDQHFFSMGFVDGASLQDGLKSGPLAPREAAELLKRIAAGVEYAHRNGIVHRDLKPANVLIDQDGQPRITDFGLAKNTEIDSGLTATGQVMGTPSYMPPEQAAGNSSEIGPRSDVYSLGAILYCLLTGRPPFQAAGMMDTLLQVLEKDPVPPRQLNPAVNADLETICLKCLQKQPGKRYSTTAALIDDLDRYLDHRPIAARPVGQWERLWRWTKRHPARAGFAIASILAAIGLLVITVGAQYQGELESALNSAEQARKRAEKAQSAETAAKEKLDQILYLRRLLLAFYEWERHKFDRARRLLADCPKGRRHWEWHYVYKLCHPELQRFQAHKGGGYSGSIQRMGMSANAEVVATAGADETIRIWDPRTGREMSRITAVNSIAPVVAVSFDGNVVASSANRGRLIQLWNPKTGRIRETLRLGKDAGFPMKLRFNKRGHRLASLDTKGRLVLWDMKSHQAITQVKVGNRGLSNDFEFSRDGKLIAITDGKTSVAILDGLTGKKLRTLDGPRKAVGLTFGPKASRIAGISDKNTIQIWDAGDGRPLLKITDSPRHLLSHVVYSPDGSRLATAGFHRMPSGLGVADIKIWDAATGKQLVVLKGYNEVIRGIEFTRDGSRLVTAGYDGTLRIWNAHQKPQPRKFPKVSAYATCIALSRDGSRFAVGGRDGFVQVVEVATGKRLYSVAPKGPGSVDGVSFSPDGNRLACVGRDVKIVDSGTGNVLANFRPLASVYRVRFSPDGRWIACPHSDGMLRIWDVVTQEQVVALRADRGGLMDVAFSPDGQRIAIACRGGRSVKVWEIKSKTLLRTLHGHKNWVSSVAYTPDGESIVSGSYDKTLKLWNADSGELIATMTGHREGITAISVSPDGKRLATSGIDGTVRVWDPATAQETLLLEGHDNRVTDVVFSADGQSLLSCAWDKTVYLWSAASGRWSGQDRN